MSEVGEHCCEQMAERVNYMCERHPDVFDCPDNLIYYSAGFGKYGVIVHDGGSAYVRIKHCPWCGTKLPESTR